MVDMISMRSDDSYKKGIGDLVSYAGLKGAIVCEIGSYRGESSELFLRTGCIDMLYCVDPWENGYDVNDIASHITPMTLIEQDFDNRMDQFFDKVTKVKKFSNNAVTSFADNMFDLVYIDGLHTYDGCKSDITNYISKVKNGGYIAGHDYIYTWAGVISAVNECVGTPDVIFQDSSWIKRVVR